MIRTWLVFLFQGLICFLIKDLPGFTENAHLVSWLIITVTSTAFLYGILHESRNITLAFILLAGYFFRLALLFWDTNIAFLVDSDADAQDFFMQAMEIMFSRVEGDAYPHFLSWFFRLFGVQQVLGQYVNILLGCTSVLIGLRILRKCNGGELSAVILTAVGMFAPYFAILNSILLRESIIVFFLAVSLYFFAVWLKGGRLSAFAAAILATLCAAVFHSGAFAATLGYAVCLVLYDRGREKFRFNKKTIFLTVFCVLAFFIIDAQLGDVVFRKFNADSIEEVVDRSMTARGGSGYTVGIQTGNAVLDMVVNTPVRMIYFVLMPFPWTWRGLNDVIAFVFSAVFYGSCFYLAFRSLAVRGGGQNRELIAALLIIALIGAFVFAWGTSNVGTAMRHRDKFFIYHLLIFALCFRKGRPCPEPQNPSKI